MFWYNKSMNKNYLILLLVLAVVAGGGYWWWQNRAGMPLFGGGQPAADSSAPVVPGGDAAVVGKIISFNGATFEPGILTIKAGETVTFRNDSAGQVWPASAMHPTHKVYPAAGGCIGSAFDACKGLMPGESWSFKFDEAGSWKYHDHLNPKNFGTVVVAE